MLINGVEFFEDADSPRSPEQQYAVDNGRVTRTLQRRDASNIGVTEVDRFEAAFALIGGPRVQGGTLAGLRWITRTPPDLYPAPLSLATGGLGYLWATSIPRTAPDGAVKGVDALGAARWACVRYTVQYSILPYLVREDADVIATTGPLAGLPDEGWAVAQGWLGHSRYVSRKWRQGGHTYTLPQGFMLRTDVAAPNNVVKQAIPYHATEGTVRYTWHQVPLDGLPETAQARSQNCVNDATFDGRARGTLLLKDVEMEQYQNAFGVWLADVTYVMSYMPNFDPVTEQFQGWNSRLMYSSGDKSFRYVPTSSDGNAPDTVFGASNNAAYPYRDFQALFRPDQP